MAEPAPSTKKVVWVLGAGFSQPLGGPLLTRLLSRRSEKEIQARYPLQNSDASFAPLHTTPVHIVRNLYEYGLSDDSLRSPTSRAHKENIWAHAEDFIDHLDTAAEPRPQGQHNPHAERLNQILRHDLSVNDTSISLQKIRDAARRIIAAECCAFLENVDPQREQWRPFRSWARSLRPTDTVISFNYDRVVEMLRDAQNDDTKRSGGEFSAIHTRVPGEEAEAAEILKTKCPFLKLHGSVDWKKGKRNGNVVAEITTDPCFALKCSDEELAIATPGPSKQRDANDFKPLWNLAVDALMKADAIVFVGYRFPETDAHARETLLRAIRENNAGKLEHHLSLHVVLGKRGEHSERLDALLRHVCLTNRNHGDPGHNSRSFRVSSHPLYAQDFFTVVNREEL